MRIIQTFDRKQIEGQFFSRQPYALLSIRRPGSRFASELVTANRVARCDLMLHEWDVAKPPYPLPPVVLSSRQAVKIADFVTHQRLHAYQLVVQSEFPSSQLTAIVETIGDWADVLVERRCDWPTDHAPTRALLEMAFDSLELPGACKPGLLICRKTVTHDVLTLLELVLSFTNVRMIHSARATACLDLSLAQALEIDFAMGVSLDPEAISSEPARENDPNFQAKSSLRTVLASRQRRLCRHGGCQDCLESLLRWNSPVCLSVIFNPRQLPSTFTPLRQAGATWAFITNREMIRPIIRLAGKDAELELTTLRNKKVALLTLGDKDACKSLHQIYRWL